MRKSYVGYYRVSTEEQGKSGLGLRSQQSDVRKFANSSGEMLGEFTEVESGKRNDRKQLNLAIDYCAKVGAILIVKSLCRISRGGHQVMSRLESLGVSFVESESPNDNQLMKEFKFSMAKDERQKISKRTSDALREIKNKISNGIEHVSKAGNVVTSLGSPQNLTSKATRKASAVRIKAAWDNIDNKKAGAFIIALRDVKDSFRVINTKLNEAGFKTSRGNRFSETQTRRLYTRYK